MTTKQLIATVVVVAGLVSALICGVVVVPIVSSYNHDANRSFRKNHIIAVRQCYSGNIQRAQNYAFAKVLPQFNLVRTRQAFGIRDCEATVSNGGTPVILDKRLQDQFVNMLRDHPANLLPVYRQGKLVYARNVA